MNLHDELARRLVEEFGGSDTVLVDRGMQPLKGVEGAWQLFAVGS